MKKFLLSLCSVIAMGCMAFSASAEEITFDFTKDTYGAGPAYTNSNTAYVTTNNVATNGSVSITFTGSSNTAWRFWSDGLRAYRNQSAAFTVATSSGNITSINLTVANGATFAVDGTSDNVTSWTGSATSVKFNYTSTAGNYAIKTITVTVEGATQPSVAAPVISCTDNMVSISCATANSSIYYTTDGTEPSNASTAYTAAFPINQTVTVKAIAYVGSDASPISTYTATYVGNYAGFQALIAEGQNAQGTVDGPIKVVYQNGQYLYVVDSQNYPMLVYGSLSSTLKNGDVLASVAGTYTVYSGLPEFTNPVIGTVTTGTATVDPINITMSQINSTTLNSYVRFNGVTLSSATAMSDGTGNGVLYKRFSDVNIPTDYTKKYIVTGFVANYNGTYQIYPVSFEEMKDANQVEAPVFDPNGGSVVAGSTVSITCATTGATIYYTTDGEDPTTSSDVYSTPIVVNEAMTIKAYAVASGMTDSYIVSASYTIIDENETEVTFNFSKPSSLDPDYSDATSNGAEVDVTDITFTNGVISITSYAEAGVSNKPRLYSSASAWTYRFYNQNSVVISAQEGYKITSIDFTATNMGNNSIVYSDGAFNNNKWTASLEDGIQSLTISKTATGNNPTITDMTVHYVKGSSDTTGVEAIGSEDGETVYYNLQGVRVNNPERGIFVKVVNGNAVKVVK